MKVFFYKLRDTIGSRLVNLLWIGLGWIILSNINGENAKKLIQTFSEYKLPIIIFFSIFFIIEYVIKYRKDFIKYTKSIIQYLYIVIGVSFLLDTKINAEIFNGWLIFLILIIVAESIMDFIYDVKGEKVQKLGNSLVESPNISYKDLFESRKIQIDNIESYIDNFDNLDRFTILLNGKWGEGKTSLVSVLEEKISEKSKIIFIQPMMFDDKEKLIEYFLSSLETLLSEEKFYTGKGSNIEKYSNILLSIVKDKTKLNMKKFLESDEKETFRKIKKNLERDIAKYSKKKKIIVIIDDFDRVAENTVKEILMFTREIIDFNGLNIIILAEYNKLLKVDGEISEKYLEKYIDKRFDLDEVTSEEVFKYFINKGIERLQGTKEKELLEIFKKNINQNLYNIEMDLQRPQREFEAKAYSLIQKDEERKKILEAKEAYQEFIRPFEESKNNIRMLKKISREFITSIEHLEIEKQQDVDIELVDIKIVFKFILLKNIINSEYSKMLECGGFEKYYKKHTADFKLRLSLSGTFLVNYFEELNKHKELLKNINRQRMIDSLIYNKTARYETETKHEKLIKEIDGNLININLNLNEDIEEVFERYYSSIFIENDIKGDFKKAQSRMKIVNEKFLEKIKSEENDIEILLRRYKDLSKFTERHIYNSYFIEDIYKYLNKNNKINKLNKKIIEPYIEDIRRENLSAITSYMITLGKILKCNSEELASGYYRSLKEYNINLIKVFNISQFENEMAQIECLNYIIKDIFEKINKSENIMKLDLECLKKQIDAFVFVEEILMKFEAELSINKVDSTMDLERALELSTNHEEFSRVSKLILANIITKDGNLGYKDINLCFSVVRNMNFYRENDNQEIYNLLGEVTDRFKNDKNIIYQNYLAFQNLLIFINDTKN